jgi:hypothetical protein
LKSLAFENICLSILWYVIIRKWKNMDVKMKCCVNAVLKFVS